MWLMATVSDSTDLVAGWGGVDIQMEKVLGKS